MSDEKKKEICNNSIKAIFEELLEKYSDTEIFLEIYDYLYDVYDDDSKIPNLFSSTVIIRCKENVVVCSVSTKNTDWKSNYENFFKVFCDSSKSSSEINDSIAENAIKIAKVSYMYEKSYGSVTVNYELKGETLNVFTEINGRKLPTFKSAEECRQNRRFCKKVKKNNWQILINNIEFYRCLSERINIEFIQMKIKKFS